MPEFDCPHGVTIESAFKIQAAVANPGVRRAEMEKQGRAAWEWLHAEAAKGALTENRITKEFEPMIPAYGCQCKKEFAAIRRTIPFRLDDQFATTVDWHNAVSASLKPSKPQMTVEEAWQAYFDNQASPL